MKHLKSYKLFESIISPSTAPGTMSLWHGGNLDDVSNDFIQQKKGRYEYGPGLYLTTNYDTAKKYAKGSRKLYMVTIESGTDISEMHLDMEGVEEFVSKNVIVSKRNEVLDRMNKMVKDGKLRADIFNNILVNTEAIKSSKSGEWRSFLASKGVDYELVHNAFGWGETMVVLFNMKNIVGKIVVKPSDKIETWDLPTEFNK